LPEKKNMLSTVRILLGRLPRFWKFQLAGWGAGAVIGFVFRLLMFRQLTPALALTLFMEPLGLGLSCLLREAYRRLPLGQGFTLKIGGVVFFGALLASGLCSVLTGVFMTVMKLPHSPWAPKDEWTMRVGVYWLVFIIWSFLYLWLKAEGQAQRVRERATEAQMAAIRLELQLLRAQLNPHFLFNALNGIAAELPEHADNALVMVRELADFLRFSLHQQKNGVIPLTTELEAMGHYLRIEQARFGDRFSVQIEAEENARYRPVPVFLLQPLVENAVKHGRHTSPPPWKVTIEAWTKGPALGLRVRNSGRWQPDSSSGSESSTGLGLSLLRRRLELLFPGRHRLTLREEDGTVCAELELEGEPCFA
jgi:two-component system, LytTR family, sensor kinase